MAILAAPTHGFINLKGHARKHGHQSQARAELRVYQKVIPADPSQSCLRGNMFMGDMSALFLPVHNLGGRNGQGLPSTILNKIGYLKGQFVQEDIHPLVVEEIKLRGTINHILDDSIG